MTINLDRNILIWSVPILLLGVAIGARAFKQSIHGPVIMIVGWITGLATLAVLELAFPDVAIYILGRTAVIDTVNKLTGQVNAANTIKLVIEWPVLTLIAIIAVLIMVFVVDWSPKKKADKG